MECAAKITGPEILFQEAREFLEKGTEAGFANPQSMTEGVYEGKYALINGKRQIDLTRLDYLSLGENGLIKDIMKRSIDQFNISCPTSQMALKSETNVRLEEAIAQFHRMEDSIIFLSGYCANVNIIQALAFRMRTPYFAPYLRETKMGVGTRDLPTEFFVDAESHYSLQYAIKSAKAQLPNQCFSQRFATADYDHLVKLLKKSCDHHGDRILRVIVSDTVSSMSGRVYDVETLCQIAEEYDCLLYLDEAHAVATWGREGRGIASEMEHFERYRNRLIIMGTLTKAIAQLGGYVVVPDKALSCFLRGCSPQYIFSAPLSPWMAETIIQVLELIRGDYGKNERQKLEMVSAYMREQLNNEGFETLSSNSQIIPVLIGEDMKCIKTKALLEENGFTTAVFMCPAVPKGKSIIRLSLCSDITRDDVDHIIEHLVTARQLFNF
jgi:7-keto-8-aminopelargonate synthetase-like enzyme